MHKAGGTIVAHDNVRARMLVGSNGSRVVEPAPEDALPVITFSDEMSMHLNGTHIKVMYVPSAHTDGDALVYFSDHNILHTGDTMLLNRYPFIDFESGGSALGFINNLESILTMIDDDTKVIPGHGSLSGKTEVQTLFDMVNKIKTDVAQMIGNGKSDEEIISASTYPQWSELEWRLGSAEKFVSRLLVEMR